MRLRHSHRGLSLSRIYQRGLRFYLFSRDAITNPLTGKVAKWHSLCLVSEGADRAREIAAALQRHNAPPLGKGDFARFMEDYRLGLMRRREAIRPVEPARAALFEKSSKELTRHCRIISEAFADFDVDQLLPVDVAAFLDQWDGRRAAQVYRSRLSDFFSWACRKGLRHDNPVREIAVPAPRKRSRYITDDEFHAIRDALMTGDDGKPTPSGPMVQCYVDLCYLLYQRTTDVRLLKWSQVGQEFIEFIPTKTEHSSGSRVAIPLSASLRDVLTRAAAAGSPKSGYVIHTSKGKPYTASGIRTAWKRAIQRAGIKDVTLKDLRAKAATDAKRDGYSSGQIQIGLAHTDAAMTAHYLRGREVPLSEISLVIPPRGEY